MLLLWLAFILTDLNGPPPVYRFLIIRATGTVILVLLVVWGFFPNKEIRGLSFAENSQTIVSYLLPLFSTMLISHNTMLDRPGT